MLLSDIKTLLDQYDRNKGWFRKLFRHFFDQRDIKRIRAVYEAEVKKGSTQLSADAEVTLFKWLCFSSCKNGSNAHTVVNQLWNAFEISRDGMTPPFYNSFDFMNQQELAGLSDRWEQLFNKKIISRVF